MHLALIQNDYSAFNQYISFISKLTIENRRCNNRYILCFYIVSKLPNSFQSP